MAAFTPEEIERIRARRYEPRSERLSWTVAILRSFISNKTEYAGDESDLAIVDDCLTAAIQQIEIAVVALKSYEKAVWDAGKRDDTV